MTGTFTDGLKIHKPPAEKVQDTGRANCSRSKISLKVLCFRFTVGEVIVTHKKFSSCWFEFSTFYSRCQTLRASAF